MVAAGLFSNAEDDGSSPPPGEHVKPGGEKQSLGGRKGKSLNDMQLGGFDKQASVSAFVRLLTHALHASLWHV